MFTCFVRYQIEPGNLDAFREYARAWIALIRKYGGTHHGYFLPGEEGDALPMPPSAFPAWGPRDRRRGRRLQSRDSPLQRDDMLLELRTNLPRADLRVAAALRCGMARRP